MDGPMEEFLIIPPPRCLGGRCFSSPSGSVLTNDYDFGHKPSDKCGFCPTASGRSLLFLLHRDAVIDKGMHTAESSFRPQTQGLLS